MAYKACDILTLTVTILFLAIPFSNAACNKEDLKALVAFKNSFPPNTFPKSWEVQDNCCLWDGVGCDHGRVTSLFFTSETYTLPVNLNGALPPSIGDLSALRSIRIASQPNLVGPIPANWAKLKQLQFLSIYNSSISGPIPSFFSQLESLIITYSKLTGSIPASLGSLPSLRTIDLSHNQLTGSIPSTLFSKLKKGLIADLDVSYNMLAGPIPKSIINVPLNSLILNDNHLTGDPSFLFSRSAPNPPKMIYLRMNKLAFDLTNVEYAVVNLEVLDLRHNKIYGSISSQIKEAKYLTYFDVSDNELCGKIPYGGHFTPTVAEYFTNNKCLCGKPLPACK